MGDDPVETLRRVLRLRGCDCDVSVWWSSEEEACPTCGATENHIAVQHKETCKMVVYVRRLLAAPLN